MYSLRFGPADPFNCRFAVSPSWETQAAVRMLTHPGASDQHRPWLRRGLSLAPALGLGPLRLLMPRHGYTPDFLAPAPAGPAATFEQEIARIRATDPAQAHAEMSRSLADTPGAAGTETGGALLADPAAAVRTLADAKARAWEALVAPYWPRVRALLAADIAHHARRLADGGLALLFAGLHPRVAWRDGTLTVDCRWEQVRELRGEGVTLVPSAFVWPDVAAGFEPPWPAALVYPARGVGALWTTAERPPDALVRLLGANRAAVLGALAEPAGTSELALRLGLAPSSVSAHLSALRGAGLLASYRVRHQVLYERTPLGEALETGNLEAGNLGAGSPGAGDPEAGGRRPEGQPSGPER